MNALTIELGPVPRTADHLALFGFGEPDRAPAPAPASCGDAAWPIPLPVLASSQPDLATERWVGDGAAATIPPEPGRFPLTLRRTGRWLGAQICVPAFLADPDALESVTEAAFRQLYCAVAKAGYPHMLRVWNYLPAINQGSGDAEIYKRFCVGRARGMPSAAEQAFPAGTAIGSGPPITAMYVQCLASTEPGTPIENPRQVSAYHYPREYGPTSPSFARAMVGGGQLLISGTASVLGHETRWPDDVIEQTREAIRNMAALTGAAGSDWEASQPVLRAYLRRERDAATVIETLRAALPPASRWVLMRGDICRSDLLVELDGVLKL